METIDITDFAKVEMRVGLVLECTIPEGSDKLVREVVDLGEEKPRVIFSGLQKWHKTEEFVGKKFIYVVNLPPRPMMGEESQGMILVAEDSDKKTFLIPVPDEIPVGALAR